MNNPERSSGWSRHPQIVTTSRVLLAAAIGTLLGASWLTAGPGNYHGLQLANAPAKLQAIHVTLPTVVVVGRREQAEPVKVASSGALNAGHSGINPADPAAIRVNLRQ